MYNKKNINSPRDWNQIGAKLGTEHAIYQKLENFMQNKDILLTKFRLWQVNVYITDQRVMCSRDPMELNFEDLEMQK